MTHFEYMQEQGQLTIDDILANESLVHDVPVPSTSYKAGDTVRITLAASDDMTVNYFRYYYPHVINKTAYIVEVKLLFNGHKNYLVNVLGEDHWMNESELI